MSLSRRGGAVLFAALLAAGAGCKGESPAPTATAARPEPVGPDATVAVEAGRDAGLDAPRRDARLTLASDVADRVQAARTRWGAAARARVVGGTYALVEIGAPTPLFDQAGDLLERALPPLFDGRFERHPDRGVTVLFFTAPGAYQAYRKTTGPDAGEDWGVYRKGPRELAVDTSGGSAFLSTLTHEAVHPLIDEDFPDAPYWLQEGLASVFDAPTFDADGGIHGVPRSWRHDVLLAGLASPIERGELRLDALFGMSPHTFKGHGTDPARDLRGLHYALVRSVCTWLDGQGKLWPFYHAWRDGFATDESGEKAFTRVMGGSPKALNGKWLAWVR